ncbi:MAG: hypothetical protein H0V67_00495 [Geodermatophilaceae bacterium]|nr:hypothetical protein [Geodermatophilaceae bacterium]
MSVGTSTSGSEPEDSEPTDSEPTDSESEDTDLVAAELISRRNYAAIDAITPYLPDLDAATRADVRSLCRFALRLLELDAEDFASFPDVPHELSALISSAHIPASPLQPDRGALGSLRPTYRLFLEVLAVRWERGELTSVLAVLHLMAEYLPLLAWEPVLGHAGDPARLGPAVRGAGSRWATEDPKCDHPRALRRSLRTVLHIVDQDIEQWQRYLDRDHSRVSAALGQCASHPTRGRPDPGRLCSTPCTVWSRLDPARAEDLERRMTLVGLFVDSPVLALRHAAPVGHGFGVPDRQELLEEWRATWDRLSTPWKGGRNPLHDATAHDTPLPGLAAFLSAVAGVSLQPLGVLDQVDDLLARRLGVTVETGEPTRPDTVAQ